MNIQISGRTQSVMATYLLQSYLAFTLRSSMIVFMLVAGLHCSQHFQFSEEMFPWKKWWITFQIMEQYNNIEEAQENGKRIGSIIRSDLMFFFIFHLHLHCPFDFPIEQRQIRFKYSLSIFTFKSLMQKYAISMVKLH